MPEITLTDGDFGTGPARADLSAFYLPDPARPGAMLIVALSDVAEIEAMAADNSRRIREGLKLSARGFASAGPVGLAAGLLAAGRVRDVTFNVGLSDGRRFSAHANADVFAEIHAAQVAARGEASGFAAADEMIARYRQSATEAGPAPAVAAPAVATVPAEVAASAAPATPPSSPRPVFGKRKR